MRSHFLLSAAAALALTACASTGTADAPPGGNDCFRADSVSGFNTVDDTHVRVSVGPSRDYILELGAGARSANLDFAQRLSLRSRSGWVCAGQNIPDIDLYGGDPPQRIWVRSVTRAPEPAPQAATAPPSGS